MAKMAVLQSGFIVKPNDKLVKSISPSVQDIVTSAVRNNSIPSAVSEFFYHPQVEGLVTKYLADPRALTRFEYREEIITVFKQAFGMLNFRTWVELQSECEYFTAFHRKFLIDTLEFLSSGKRRMDIESWHRILYDTAVVNAPKRERINTNDWFGEPKPNPKPWDGLVPTLTNDVICRWLEKPAGFKDLLFFAAIMFAERKVQ